MDEKKLFLLDAYALIYRAYYAMIRAPRVTSGGMNTSAVFGFCNTLDEILRKEKPTHIAVCFDPPHGRTFRHEVYPEYKAQRDAQPEDITVAVPYIKRILEAYRIPVLEMERYEADDLIGTLSRKAEEEGYITYMMTPDKDYGQLVTDKVLMYRPALRGQGFEVRGPKEVCERYGISSPIQVIDLLALEGDASDNVPGCPGVGEKTAAKLIAQWGNVENLLDHTDELKGALQKKIVEHAEQIRFSKMLVTIKTDVPMDADIASFRREDPDVGKLIEVYTELEFRTFISRLKGNEANSDNSGEIIAPTKKEGYMRSLFDEISDVPLPSQEVAGEMKVDMDVAKISVSEAVTPADVAHIVKRAAGCEAVGVSLFAPQADAMSARWLAAAIAFTPSEACFIPLPADDTVERGEVLPMLAPLFTSGARIVSADIKRDIVLLACENIEFTSDYFDTSLAHYLLQPESRNSIDNTARIYLNVALSSIGEDGKMRQKPEQMGMDDLRRVLPEEACVALALEPVLRAKVKAQDQSICLMRSSCLSPGCLPEWNIREAG